MNTFASAVFNQVARTKNDMKARKTTSSACVDLFYKIAASRGNDITADFVAAYVENKDVAIRIAQWARDIRGGAGERQLFRDIFAYLDKYDASTSFKLVEKIPEIGRWDDLLIDFTNKELESYVYAFYFQAVMNGNKLAAKWAPRKGPKSSKLAKAWGLTAKQYRKFIVANTNVVETLMCAKEWNKINFSHVPSLASARYKSAFYRNAEEAYTAYIDKLISGDKSVKVNASAVYPYDVVKGLFNLSEVQLDLVQAQWDALPNYIGDASILPMVDVSGSMTCNAGNSKVTCLDVAISLGMYCSEKNIGKFKDMFLTFSDRAELITLKGSVFQRYQQLFDAYWGMNTNLHNAFNRVLDIAIKGHVDSSEMPKTILILSDMQFDRCVRFDDSALEMIKRKYEIYGYIMPNIVFWNLNSYENVPVKFNQEGVALVSGFSPAILKSVLSSTLDSFTPESVMLEAVMIERYTL